MDQITSADRDAILRFFLADASVSNPKESAAFLDLYQDLVIPKTINGCNIQIDEELLRDHRHLQDVAETLRKDPRLTREEFIRLNFPLDAEKVSVREHDPTSVVVQLGYMLSCDLNLEYVQNRHIGGWQPARWDDNETFHDFVARTAPAKAHGVLPPQQDRNKLAIWKLESRCKVKVVATNNIAEHLLYNPKNGSLRVFHHLTWLHTQLERSQANDLTLEDSLKR